MQQRPRNHQLIIKKAIKNYGVVTVIELILKGLGFVAGILIIRLLPKDEYAYYTIVNTMIGSIVMMSGAGISSGVLKMGGQVYTDKLALGGIIKTALALRSKIGVVCYLLMCPVVYYMLTKNGASGMAATLLCMSMFPAFYSQLSSELYMLTAKLHQDLIPMQYINLSQSLLRLVINVGTLVIFPFAAVAILGAGLAQLFANVRLKNLSRRFTDVAAEENPKVKREFVSIIKRAMPTAIYFHLSGQISVWLLSLFGTVQGVAEIGALSRLSMVFAVFNSIFSMTVAPRFARIPDDKQLLTTRFLQIQAGLLLMALLVTLLIALFSNQLLWILGKDYEGLSRELTILGGTIGLSVLINGLASLVQSRAFILHPLIHIPFNIIVLVASVLLINPDTTENVLWIDLARASVAPLLLNFIFFRYLNKNRVYE